MNKLILLTAAFCYLITNCTTKSSDKIFAPQQETKFVWIYQPDGDHFFGPDTKNFKESQWYDEWVPNDHTFVKHTDGHWHIFGITHPLVLTDPLKDGIHEGEYASFHAVSSQTSFEKTLENHAKLDHRFDYRSAQTLRYDRQWFAICGNILK